MDVNSAPGVSALFSALGYTWKAGQVESRTIHTSAFCTGNVGQTTGLQCGQEAGHKRKTRVVLSTTLLLPLLSLSHCGLVLSLTLLLSGGLYCKGQGALSTFQSMSVLGLGTEMSSGLGL